MVAQWAVRMEQSVEILVSDEKMTCVVGTSVRRGGATR